MTDFVIPDSWPLWTGLLLLFVKLFQKELATFLPAAIREHFASRAQLRQSQQEHDQELEEVSVEALAQSSVTAQMQLIQVNKRLVDFLTTQIDQRLGDIEQTLTTVREQSIKSQAQSNLVQVEWSRVVDTLTRTEKLLHSLETWFKSMHKEKDAPEPGQTVSSSGMS